MNTTQYTNIVQIQLYMCVPNFVKIHRELMEITTSGLHYEKNGKNMKIVVSIVHFVIKIGPISRLETKEEFITIILMCMISDLYNSFYSSI